MEKNLQGFLLEKELADSQPEDYLLGSSKQPDLKGMSDDVAGIDWALYAWSSPRNGVYPRVAYQFNHASLGISEKAKLYIPDGTVQRGREDWMNCTSNAPCNDLEIQFNYGIVKGKFTPALVEWFKEVGFINKGKFEIADAYSSIGSGTTRSGNSLKAPLEFIRKNGIVPKSKMPDDRSMNWSQYHDKKRMTPELKAIADEILKYIKFGYERVNYVDFPKFTGKTKWDNFDSYTDPVDGDFIKRLAPDYRMMNYGYHLTINQIGEPQSKDDNMQKQRFYKQKGRKEVYQIGLGDGLYHHIVDEPVFQGLYGNFNDNEIIELDSIPENKIGFTVYNKQSVANLFNKLFK